MKEKAIPKHLHPVPDPGSAPAPAYTVEILGLDALVDDPENVRVHSARNLSVIGDSLAENGAVRSIAIDENNQIIAGHGVTEAARDRQFDGVIVIDTPGNYLIAHRRSNMTPEQKIRAALSDNAASDLSFWDDAKLGLLAADHPDLLAGIFSDTELEALLAVGTVESGKGQLREDQGPRLGETAELVATWGTAPGQLWQVPSLTVPGAAHRLICSDSADPATWATLAAGQPPIRLVVTDPPYGVDYSDKNRFLNKGDKGHRLTTPISGDVLTPEALTVLIRAALYQAGQYTDPGSGVYVCGPQGPLMLVFLNAFLGSGFSFRQGLVWVKQHFVIGMKDYHYRHEMVFYGWRDGAAHYFTPDRTLDSVFQIDKPASSTQHPTTKPVELFTQFVLHASRPGDTLADPFAGSGTLGVAAEQEGRVALLADIDPGNLAIMLQRLTDLGLTPERVS